MKPRPCLECGGQMHRTHYPTGTLLECDLCGAALALPGRPTLLEVIAIVALFAVGLTAALQVLS